MALYAEHGAAHAARETGVPAGTVKSWASRGAEVMPRQERQQRRIDAIARNTAERKVALIDKLGQVAELGVDWAKAMLESGEELTLREVVGAWTRAIHDLQLLAGDATARTETVATEARERAAQAVSKLDELAQRRDSAA